MYIIYEKSGDDFFYVQQELRPSQCKESSVCCNTDVMGDGTVQLETNRVASVATARALIKQGMGETPFAKVFDREKEPSDDSGMSA